jgi:hypothetical protein
MRPAPSMAPRRRSGRRRFVQPRQRGRIDARRAQLQHRGGEIRAEDLGRVVIGALLEVELRIEPQRAARRGAARAAGALDCRSAADVRHPQRREARPLRMRGDAREARVHDRSDALDGHAGLGDVGGEDDLAPGPARDGAVLLVGPEVAVQRRQEQAAGPRDLLARLLRVADLGGAGQEDQHVPVGRARRGQLADGRGDLIAQAPLVGLLEVLDGDGKAAALAAHDGRAQELRQRRCVERGGHDHELEVASLPQQPQQQGQREVALQVALVELVEHHRAHAPEVRIPQQPAREDALGDVAQPGPGRGDLVEADLIADRLAWALAQLLRDAPRRGARRQPPRLEHDDLARHQREQRGRHARGLARARRRLEHQRRSAAQGREDLRQRLIDGEWFAHAL